MSLCAWRVLLDARRSDWDRRDGVDRPVAYATFRRTTSSRRCLRQGGCLVGVAGLRVVRRGAFLRCVAALRRARRLAGVATGGRGAFLRGPVAPGRRAGIPFGAVSALAGSAALAPDLDLGASDEARHAVDDHALAGRESLADDALASLRARDDHGARLDRGVWLDHEHVLLPLLAGLYRAGRDHDRIGLGGERQRDVRELPGPEPLVLVGESRLQPDCARGRVDGIVDERHHAAQRLRIAGGDRGDREPAFGHVALDDRELLLGHGERDIDGLDLVDHDQGGVTRAARPHDIALVEHQAPGAPVDRRADVRVAELELGVLHGGLVGAHGLFRALDGGLVGTDGLLRALDVRLVGADRRREGIGGGPEAVVLLLRDQPALQEVLVALGLHFRIARLGLIPQHGRAGLTDARPVA